MGRRQRADRGSEELVAPTKKAKDPSPQQTNPRGRPASLAENSTGPLVGPSRIRFHWARRSTMTWRHAGWSLGSSGGVGGFCLSCSIYEYIGPRLRWCHFVAPMLTAQVGSQLHLFLSLLSAFLSTPDHETSGPLLAPAQTWLSSFVTSGALDAQERRRGKWGGVHANLAKRAIRCIGRLETSEPCRASCIWAVGSVRGGTGRRAPVRRYCARSKSSSMPDSRWVCGLV